MNSKHEEEEDAYTKSNPMSAICVKYLIEKEAAASPEELEDEDESTNLKGYVTTFRISNKTTFNDLLKEACSFWVFVILNRENKLFEL